MPPSDIAPSRPPGASAGYYYRRELGVRELVPAIAAAIGAGLVAFYLTRLLLQRTPLKVDRGARGARPRDSRTPHARALSATGNRPA